MKQKPGGVGVGGMTGDEDPSSSWWSFDQPTHPTATSTKTNPQQAKTDNPPRIKITLPPPKFVQPTPQQQVSQVLLGNGSIGKKDREREFTRLQSNKPD